MDIRTIATYALRKKPGLETASRREHMESIMKLDAVHSSLYFRLQLSEFGNLKRKKKAMMGCGNLNSGMQALLTTSTSSLHYINYIHTNSMNKQ